MANRKCQPLIHVACFSSLFYVSFVFYQVMKKAWSDGGGEVNLWKYAVNVSAERIRRYDLTSDLARFKVLQAAEANRYGCETSKHHGLGGRLLGQWCYKPKSVKTMKR